MLVTELIPLLKELSHTDKLLLIHFLAAELLKESSLVPLDAQNKIASLGLYDSFETARDRNAPLILGYMNFFLAFDVCFYRSELAFEITSKIV
ncbi:MAG: hypothetical protein V7K88_04170 [Nostoc sp.]